jgi:hypothetical protein
MDEPSCWTANNARYRVMGFLPAFTDVVPELGQRYKISVLGFASFRVGAYVGQQTTRLVAHLIALEGFDWSPSYGS